MAQLPVVFITENESSFGLAPELTTNDLELNPTPLFRTKSGGLTLFRFNQSYHGFPIFGPDRLVTLVANHEGTIAIRGAPIDGRVKYLHADKQASRPLGESSALLHASQLTGIPVQELRIANAFLAAVPRARSIGWAAIVTQGLSQVAVVVVEADPSVQELLPLLHISQTHADGLADTSQVTVRSEDLNSEITMGDPLTGAGIETVDFRLLLDFPEAVVTFLEALCSTRRGLIQ